MVGSQQRDRRLLGISCFRLHRQELAMSSTEVPKAIPALRRTSSHAILVLARFVETDPGASRELLLRDAAPYAAARPCKIDEWYVTCSIILNVINRQCLEDQVMGFEIVGNLNAEDIENMKNDEVWNFWVFPSFFSAVEKHPEFQSPTIGWLLVIGLYNTMQDDFDGMGR